MGAASGGATGAGGEAPKLLLRQNRNQEVWIDTFQDDPYCLDDFYLVKFPRNNRSAIDQDILRAEYHYYQELNALGIDTIPIHGMRLDEGSKYPSLTQPQARTLTIWIFSIPCCPCWRVRPDSVMLVSTALHL